MSDAQTPKPADMMPVPPAPQPQPPVVSEPASDLRGYVTLPEGEQALIKGHYFSDQYINITSLCRIYSLHRTSVRRVADKEGWEAERKKLWASVQVHDFKTNYMKRMWCIQAVLQKQAELYYQDATLSLLEGSNQESDFSYKRFKEFLKFQKDIYDQLSNGGFISAAVNAGNKPLMSIDIADHPKLANVLNVVLEMITSRAKPNVNELDPAIIDAEAKSIDPAKGERK